MEEIPPQLRDQILLFGHMWYILTQKRTILREYIFGVGSDGAVYKIELYFNDKHEAKAELSEKNGLVYGSIPLARSFMDFHLSIFQKPNRGMNLKTLTEQLENFRNVGIIYLNKRKEFNFRDVFLGLDEIGEKVYTYCSALAMNPEDCIANSNRSTAELLQFLRTHPHYHKDSREISLGALTRADGFLFYRILNLSFTGDPKTSINFAGVL